MSSSRTPCRLAALGVLSALGADAEAVWRGLVAGEPSRLSWNDRLVPGRRLLVGAVTEPRPPVPPALARYACRNNALALAALAQIEAETRAAIARCGAGRVVVFTVPIGRRSDRAVAHTASPPLDANWSGHGVARSATRAPRRLLCR